FFELPPLLDDERLLPTLRAGLRELFFDDLDEERREPRFLGMTTSARRNAREARRLAKIAPDERGAGNDGPSAPQRTPAAAARTRRRAGRHDRDDLDAADDAREDAFALVIAVAAHERVAALGA